MKLQIESLRPEERVTLQLRGLYEAYGYKKYRMSRFEEYSLYAANKKFLAGENVITFTDLDGRLLALKPDVTLSIAKNTKANRENREKPYYIENVYRESKESHTYKEINQMGLEVIGNVDRYTIIEVLSLAERSLNAISAQSILSMSNMDFVLGFFEEMNLEEESIRKIFNCLRKKNENELEKAGKETKLSDAELKILSKIAGMCGDFQKTLSEAKEIAINNTMRAALEELSEIYKALRILSIGKKIQLDFSIINDTDYYNGIVFKGYVAGIPRSVLAGGEYSVMMEKMGRDADAIGFALYLNELQSLSTTRPLYDVEAIVLYGEEIDCGKLALSVRKLKNEGNRVIALKKIPEGLRYEKLYRFSQEGLKEVTGQC